MLVARDTDQDACLAPSLLYLRLDSSSQVKVDCLSEFSLSLFVPYLILNTANKRDSRALRHVPHIV